MLSNTTIRGLLERLHEHEMARDVFAPILQKRGVNGVRFTGGSSEIGIDLEYYEVSQPDGRRKYTGIQFKKGNLTSSARGISNSVKEVKNQAEEAFTKELYATDIGSSFRIHRFICAVTGEINEPARRDIRSAKTGGGGQIDFWEGGFLCDLIRESWATEFCRKFDIDAEADLSGSKHAPTGKPSTTSTPSELDRHKIFTRAKLPRNYLTADETARVLTARGNRKNFDFGLYVERPEILWKIIDPLSTLISDHLSGPFDAICGTAYAIVGAPATGKSVSLLQAAAVIAERSGQQCLYFSSSTDLLSALSQIKLLRQQSAVIFLDEIDNTSCSELFDCDITPSWYEIIELGIPLVTTIRSSDYNSVSQSARGLFKFNELPIADLSISDIKILSEWFSITNIDAQFAEYSNLVEFCFANLPNIRSYQFRLIDKMLGSWTSIHFKSLLLLLSMAEIDTAPSMIVNVYGETADLTNLLSTHDRDGHEYIKQLHMSAMRLYSFECLRQNQTTEYSLVTALLNLLRRSTTERMTEFSVNVLRKIRFMTINSQPPFSSFSTFWESLSAGLSNEHTLSIDVKKSIAEAMCETFHTKNDRRTDSYSQMHVRDFIDLLRPYADANTKALRSILNLKAGILYSSSPEALSLARSAIVELLERHPLDAFARTLFLKLGGVQTKSLARELIFKLLLAPLSVDRGAIILGIASDLSLFNRSKYLVKEYLWRYPEADMSPRILRWVSTHNLIDPEFERIAVDILNKTNSPEEVHPAFEIILRSEELRSKGIERAIGWLKDYKNSAGAPHVADLLLEIGSSVSEHEDATACQDAAAWWLRTCGNHRGAPFVAERMLSLSNDLPECERAIEDWLRTHDDHFAAHRVLELALVGGFPSLRWILPRWLSKYDSQRGIGYVFRGLEGSSLFTDTEKVELAQSWLSRNRLGTGRYYVMRMLSRFARSEADQNFLLSFMRDEDDQQLKERMCTRVLIDLHLRNENGQESVRYLKLCEPIRILRHTISERPNAGSASPAQVEKYYQLLLSLIEAGGINEDCDFACIALLKKRHTYEEMGRLCQISTLLISRGNYAFSIRLLLFFKNFKELPGMLPRAEIDCSPCQASALHLAWMKGDWNGCCASIAKEYERIDFRKGGTELISHAVTMEKDRDACEDLINLLSKRNAAVAFDVIVGKYERKYSQDDRSMSFIGGIKDHA